MTAQIVPMPRIYRAMHIDSAAATIADRIGGSRAEYRRIATLVIEELENRGYRVERDHETTSKRLALAAE